MPFGSLQWIESEKMRLAHLRDRASDMGHRKEYPFGQSLINQYLVLVNGSRLWLNCSSFFVL